MGINVQVQKQPKPIDIITVQAKLDKDLKSCMRCRFFYGNDSQCIAKKCCKEELLRKPETDQTRQECIGCPYKQSEQYCFPCMKKLLGLGDKEEHEKIILEKED